MTGHVFDPGLGHAPGWEGCRFCRYQVNPGWTHMGGIPRCPRGARPRWWWFALAATLDEETAAALGTWLVERGRK